MRQFWNFIQKDPTRAELFLEGEIASEESWWYDTLTPTAFRKALAACTGDIVVWLNSPGGDPFAGSAIYTALMEYKGKKTVKVPGLAASAASVIAMAADELLMAPTAYLMVHNPWTVATGDSRELTKTAGVLDEIRDGMISAYMRKTKLNKDQITQYLDDETYMNAASAVKNGFADGILYAENDPAAADKDKLARAQYSRGHVFAMALDAVQKHPKEPAGQATPTAPEIDAYAARRKEIALRAGALAADITA